MIILIGDNYSELCGACVMVAKTKTSVWLVSDKLSVFLFVYKLKKIMSTEARTATTKTT